MHTAVSGFGSVKRSIHLTGLEGIEGVFYIGKLRANRIDIALDTTEWIKFES